MQSLCQVLLILLSSAGLEISKYIEGVEASFSQKHTAYNISRAVCYIELYYPLHSFYVYLMFKRKAFPYVYQLIEPLKDLFSTFVT